MFLPIFELTDLNVYTELKSRLSRNPLFPYHPFEVFQEVSFKVKSKISDELLLWLRFKSKYAQFHWKRTDRLILLDAGALEYRPFPVGKLAVGSVYVDYSPYIVMCYPWIMNRFLGLSFEYNTYKFYFHTFVAIDRENPDESSWEPPVDFDLDYSLIDLGYESEKEHRWYLPIWVGCKLTYNFGRNFYFTPATSIIFLREHYTKRDYNAGYVDINTNEVVGFELNFTLFDYAKFNNIFATTWNQIDKYSVDLDYFGEGKHRLLFSEVAYGNYSALKTRMEINDAFLGLFGQYNTVLFLEYEKVDPLYHPVYMNQNLDNRTINPYENIYSGREGIWCGIYQNIGRGFFIGLGYQRYLYRQSYYHSFPDGAIFTEKQIILKNNLYKSFRLFFIYQIRQMERGTLPEGGKTMQSFYLRLESDVTDNIYLGIEYSKNKNFYTNYDELLLKSLVWGW